MELANFNNENVSSVYLVEQINLFRGQENNEKVLLHKSLLAKIESEFFEEISQQNILPSTYLANNGKNEKCYYLDFEQSLQLLMSESKTVRKKCVNVIVSQKKQSTPNIPKSFSEALLLASNLQQQLEEQAPKIKVFDRVLDGMNTYTLDSVSDTLNIGRTTLCKLLEAKKWKMLTSKDGTASTRYSEINGYAKTVFEVIPIGNNREKKIKKFVLTKKGLDKLISEL